MDFVLAVKDKYPWLSTKDAQAMVEKAKFFYFSLAYPANLSVNENTHPIDGFRKEQWILAACDELVERLGFSSAVGYRENGVTWTFDNAQISMFLTQQIMPVVGTVE